MHARENASHRLKWKRLLSCLYQLPCWLAVSGAIDRVAAQDAVREWRVVVHQISGNLTFCRPGGTFWIREGKGKMAMLSGDKYSEVWSIAQASDGSVSGETRQPGSNIPLRMQIPGPVGPREFEYLNWASACRYKVMPAQN